MACRPAILRECVGGKLWSFRPTAQTPVLMPSEQLDFAVAVAVDGGQVVSESPGSEMGVDAFGGTPSGARGVGCKDVWRPTIDRGPGRAR
jgi:hypothetical protein